MHNMGLSYDTVAGCPHNVKEFLIRLTVYDFRTLSICIFSYFLLAVLMSGFWY